MIARIMNPAASAHPIMIAVSLADSGSLRGAFLVPFSSYWFVFWFF